MPGDCISVSTTPMRFPMRAKRAARFAVAFDFPVPPRKECTDMILAMHVSPGIVVYGMDLGCPSPAAGRNGSEAQAAGALCKALSAADLRAARRVRPDGILSEEHEKKIGILCNGPGK